MFTAIYFFCCAISWLFFYVTLATNVDKQFNEEQIIILCLSGIIALMWPISIIGVFVLIIGKKLVNRINKKEDQHG